MKSRRRICSNVSLSSKPHWAMLITISRGSPRCPALSPPKRDQPVESDKKEV
jgi:hypothetical protein